MDRSGKAAPNTGERENVALSKLGIARDGLGESDVPSHLVNGSVVSQPFGVGDAEACSVENLLGSFQVLLCVARSL